MSTCFAIYPAALLEQLKKGENFKQELSDEILRVLKVDQEIQEAIKAITDAKLQELLERSGQP